jgi:uncharacterized membrane protein
VTPTPPRGHLTSRALTFGSVVASACFVLALVLELVGRRGQPSSGDGLSVDALLRGLVAPEALAWAVMGVLVVIGTPAVGLVATAWEYRGRREALLALVVLGILGISLGVALAG